MITYKSQLKNKENQRIQVTKSRAEMNNLTALFGKL